MPRGPRREGYGREHLDIRVIAGPGVSLVLEYEALTPYSGASASDLIYDQLLMAMVLGSSGC